MLSLMLALSLCGQDHILQSRTRGDGWKHITGPSQAVKAKRARDHATMHAAAERGRHDFDAALRILRSTPLAGCPCTRPGARGFE